MVGYERKNKEQLLKELEKMRQKIVRLEKLESRHKELERALRESKKRYKFLIDNSKDIILILSKRGKILFANRSALVNYGYSKEEIFGQSITRFLSKDCIRKALHALAQEFLGRPQPPLEVRVKTKTGEIRYLRVARGSTSIIENGKFIGVMINAYDITESKQAEEALKKSEKHFKELWDNAPVAYHTLNTGGIITSVNQTEADMLGYTPREMVGKSIFEFILREQRAEAKKRFQHKISGENILRSEDRIYVRKDGSEIHVIIDDVLERDSSGKVIGIRTTMVDITHQKQMEEELREKEMTYRALFEHANDAVFLLNLEGIHIAANRKAAEMLGYTTEELIGKSYRDIVATHEIDKAKEKLEGILKSQNFPTYERIFRRKDGTEFPVEINVSVIYYLENKPFLIQRIVRDISERKRAEEALKASLKEKEVLLREIHHRVKNNMQVISSLINLQSRYVQDEKALEIFKKSRERIRSMALIHEKLYLSKNLAQIDFGEYIEGLTIHLLHSSGVNPSSIKVDINVRDIFLDINTAIPCGLIINELVSNSLKHAFSRRKEGKVRIDMHSVRAQFTLIVSDNGDGFPEHLDFQKTQSLGMQLVNDLVKQLSGSIKLQRGNGTTFKIKFRSLE